MSLPLSKRLSMPSTPPMWLSLGTGQAWVAVVQSKCETPVLDSSVRDDFLLPTEDYIEGSLDLNRHLIRHPETTFIVRVADDSMSGIGVFPGDLLVVDRSIEPHEAHMVVVLVAGELTVRRLKMGVHRGDWQLVAEHPDYPPINMQSGEGGGGVSDIWGVVTHSVRCLSTIDLS